MRNQTIPLEFMTRNSATGSNHVAASIDLINHSGFPDGKAVKGMERFLRAYTIDCHPADENAPIELPTLYETKPDGREQFCIYPPRGGKITAVTENEEAPRELRESFHSKGRIERYTHFSSVQTDYSIEIE